MLKDYLLDVMQQHEHGLYMCELPTGNGKTYDSARAMKEYTDSIGNDTKIIYLTTLNKNLPEDALRAAYGSEELYKRNVLRLRSNFDEVVDKILEIEVPEEMKTDAYLKLCKDVSLYRNAVEKRYADKEYIKELADRITEGDRQLRYEIIMNLRIMILIMTIQILNLLRYMILLKKSCYTLQEKQLCLGYRQLLKLIQLLEIMI